MKTAIVYYSKHHGNTKKLLDAIAEKHAVTLIDASAQEAADLSVYDRIGFASGIYFSKFHKSVLDFAKKHLPEGKEVFFLCTGGAMPSGCPKSMTDAVQSKSAHILGHFGCLGYDTYGPFKLVGGIAKGHPNQTDCQNAVAFFERL